MMVSRKTFRVNRTDTDSRGSLKASLGGLWREMPEALRAPDAKLSP